MKYTARLYADALAAALHEATSREQEKTIIGNFAKLVLKRGDEALLPKALELAERLLAKQGKGDVVVIESARPLSNADRTKFTKQFSKAGHVEERIVPSLVAGVRITVNDERELDASLVARLRTLFT